MLIGFRGYIPGRLCRHRHCVPTDDDWVSDGLGAKAPTAHLDEGLYEVSASRIIARINSVSENVHSLMMVSHLPGVQDAAQRLMSPILTECVHGCVLRFPALFHRGV